MTYNKDGSKENVMFRFYLSTVGEMLIHPSEDRALNQGQFGLNGQFLPYSDPFMTILSNLGLFSAYLRHLQPNYGQNGPFWLLSGLLHVLEPNYEQLGQFLGYLSLFRAYSRSNS